MKRGYALIIITCIVVYLSFGFATQIFYNYFGDNMFKVLDVPTYVWAGFNFFNDFKADPMRPLGYPIILGLPFLFKASISTTLYWATGINALAWVTISVLIYKTLLLFTSERYSLCFALLFIICVGNLEFVYMLLSENIYTLVLTWTIFLVASYLVKKKLNYLGWAFVLFCFSILIRPTFLPMLPAVLIVCSWIAYRSIKEMSKAIVIKYSMLLLFGVGLIFSQMAMMKKDYGSFAISYNGEKTIYSYIDAYANSMLTKTKYLDERNNRAYIQYYYLSNHLFKGYDSLCSDDLRFQVVHNTGNFLKALKTDIVCNMLMPGNFNITNKKSWPFFDSIKQTCIFMSAWQNVFFTIFISISIFIAFLMRKCMSKASILIILVNWLLAVFSIVISGISFWQGNRFSVIYTPMVLISVALIIQSIRNRGSVKLV